jgi:hypothetical protein
MSTTGSNATQNHQIVQVSRKREHNHGSVIGHVPFSNQPVQLYFNVPGGM